MDSIIAQNTWSVLTERLLEPLNGVGPIRLLDAGSGSGSIALWLIKNYPDIKWEATLLDSSMEALSVAGKLAIREGLGKNISTMHGNILKMPFPAESFDLVMNEGVMDHFDPRMRQKAFSEMSRITKTNGRLMVIVPNALNPFYRLQKTLNEYNGTWKYGFEKGYTLWELTQIFKNLNFTDIRTTGDSILRDSQCVFDLILAAVHWRGMAPAGNGRRASKEADGFKIVAGGVNGVRRIIEYGDVSISRRIGRILARNIGIIGRKRL